MLKFLKEELPVMPSSSHRPNDVVCKAWDNPHFFKVVLADALREQKLEIPRKFVREYGVSALLNDQICLKVADGKEWNLGLTKSNNGRRVWLHNGWQNFVEFYSVKLGYFLVFKYQNQCSSFYVLIFDLTATEIEYPMNKIRLDDAEKKVKMETSLIDLDQVSYSQETLDFEVGKVKFGAIELMNNERNLSSMTSRRARAMANATAFQSMTLNPSFMCKMSPSHIHPGKCLHVPRSFVEMHLEEATDIILQVSDGRFWGARCGFYLGKRMRKRAELIGGWRKFRLDNNLKVGDFCVFEMISKSSRRICFKVEIFRAS